MRNSKPKAKPEYVGVGLIDESVGFDPEMRERLKDLYRINRKAEHHPEAAGFVDALESIYQEFLTLVDLHGASSPKPAQTLAAVTLLEREIKPLSRLLSSGQDTAAICEAGLAAGVKDNWLALRARLLAALDEAACYLIVTRGKLESSTGGARRGPLEDHAANFLGIAVKHLFKKHELPLSTTEDGLFDKVLCQLLSLSQLNHTSVRYLIRKILPAKGK